MAKHRPGSAWALRSGVLGVNVRTASEEVLLLSLPSDPSWMRVTQIEMNRKDARLLAKRINECLDATRS